MTLTKEGKADRVVAVVSRLAKGEIDQSQAVKLASTETNKGKTATKAATVKVRAGRAVYCDMRTARNVVRMEFQSEEEANAVQEELKSFLERRAERMSGQPDRAER